MVTLKVKAEGVTCNHLYKVDASLIRGSSKAGHVPYDSASQGNEGAFSIESLLQGCIPHLAEDLQAFVFLSIRKNNCLY